MCINYTFPCNLCIVCWVMNHLCTGALAMYGQGDNCSVGHWDCSYMRLCPGFVIDFLLLFSCTRNLLEDDNVGKLQWHICSRQAISCHILTLITVCDFTIFGFVVVIGFLETSWIQALSNSRLWLRSWDCAMVLLYFCPVDIIHNVSLIMLYLEEELLHFLWEQVLCFYQNFWRCVCTQPPFWWL